MRTALVRTALALSLAARASSAHAQADAPGWFERVLATKAEQPRWMTPLITVTPRLEQEFRYDVQRRSDPDSTNFGFNKGLELIPAERVEIIVAVPPYIARPSPSQSGFGDISLLVKYRIWASPEDRSNAIVTAFLGVSLPTGQALNGGQTDVWTPTIAAGKGWGRFDVQSTAGVSVPADGSAKTAAWNVAAQYHLGEHLWPEVEANTTFFITADKRQTLITPGLIVGRFVLPKRIGLAVGVGVGFPVTSYHTESRRVTVTVRLPFPI